MPEEKKHEKKESKEDIVEEIKKEESKILKDLKKNPWIAATFIFAIAALILLFVAFRGGGSISEKVASQKAVDFYKVYNGMEIIIDSVKGVGSFYELSAHTADGQKGNVYISKDGEYLASGLISFSEVEKAASDQTTAPAVEVPKSDKPVVELFVWSFCPGGVYGESVLKPVADLLKDKVDARVRFIGPVTTDKDAAGSSCFASRGKSADDGVKECCKTYTYSGKTYYSCALHNNKDNLLESEESERQACVYKNYGILKLLAYQEDFNANCISKKSDSSAFATCWKNSLTKIGGSASVISSCMASQEGLKILIDDYEYGQGLGGIGASPSYFVNGVQVETNTADALKQQVCVAFNTAPSECSGQVAAQTDISNSGASCG